MGGKVGRGVCNHFYFMSFAFRQIWNVNNRETFEKFRKHLACSALARSFRGGYWPVNAAESAEMWLWFYWVAACCENWWGLEEGRLKLISDKMCECKCVSLGENKRDKTLLSSEV